MNELEIMALLADRQPPLTPKKAYNGELTEEIDSLSAPEIVKAGLHLLNDDLESAHVIAQAMEGDSSADYWHAIVHRREGDYGNARYWFARVGPHPVLTETYGNALGADRFVESCRAARYRSDPALEAQQMKEMLRLLEFVKG